MDNDTTQKIILVTGASSGIGAATAEHLAMQGHHIVLGARREQRLHDAVERITGVGGSAEAVALDVTDRQSHQAVVDGIVERHGRLDVLVANAGVMPLSMLDAGLQDEWRRMVEVNIMGLLNGIGAALPGFLERGSGHLVTVASIAAHEVVPTAAVYSGTKHAVRAITEGLRQESPAGVRVTTINPGVTTSELAESITDPLAAAAMVEYRAAAIPASAIAEAIGYAIAQPAEIDVNEMIIRPAAQR